MFKLISAALVLGLLSTGCIIHPRGNGHRARHSRASCPPSYHWNGGACVHNGRARGHKKHKHRH